MKSNKQILIIIIICLINISFVNALFIQNNSSTNNITLISPVNNEVYYRIKVNFNLESNEILKEISYANLDKTSIRCAEEEKYENTCWQVLCKDCYGFGNNKERKLTMEEGINRLVIRIIDKNGNLYYQSINLTVDSTKPRILSTSPRKNKFTNGSYFNIRYNEQNLKSITLVYGNDKRIKNVTRNCPSGYKQSCNFSLNLSEYENKPIYYYFIVKNILYTEATKMTRVIVDTIKPHVYINSPVNGKNYFKKVPINITVTEGSKIEYIDSYDNYPIWKRLCNNCISYGLEKKSQKIFSHGEHNLLIRATDKAGNFDIKEVNFFMD